MGNMCDGVKGRCEATESNERSGRLVIATESAKNITRNTQDRHLIICSISEITGLLVPNSYVSNYVSGRTIYTAYADGLCYPSNPAPAPLKAAYGCDRRARYLVWEACSSPKQAPSGRNSALELLYPCVSLNP